MWMRSMDCTQCRHEWGWVVRCGSAVGYTSPQSGRWWRRGWSMGRLATLFLVATILVAVLLIVEHATVRRWGTSRMALTFFTLNGVVSCVLAAAGIIDLL